MRDCRVCLLGDSFVAGVGDPDHLGWPGRLAQRSHRGGLALTTYNLGVRGDTSADVRARWESECAARLPVTSEGRVVVSFGVNDTTATTTGPRVSAEQSTANLTAILAGAREAGWSALVVGPPPVADGEHNQRTAALDGVLHGVATAEGAAFVSVLPALLSDPVWMREVAAGDGAHPGAGGYAALAELVWPRWAAWLG